jgi:hypothetical protein
LAEDHPKETDVSYDIDGLLTFSKYKQDRGPVLLPDPYMVCNWGGALHTINDPYRWNQKTTSACFYGTTTGRRDPAKNERLNFCHLCHKSNLHSDFLNCKITKIAQMHPNDIIQYFDGQDNFMKIYQQTPVSYTQQMKHKFLISMDGNTCRYDVWNYKTNSVTLKSRSQEMLWYYPFMRAGEHFIEFDPSDITGLGSIVKKYGDDEPTCQRISGTANAFIHQYSQPIAHMQYTVSLFESMADNR